MIRNKMAFSELLWENYYTLDTTPAQAMVNIWDELANGTLVSWAHEEHGIDTDSLLRIIGMLTNELRHMDLSKSAMEAIK